MFSTCGLQAKLILGLGNQTWHYTVLKLGIRQEIDSWYTHNLIMDECSSSYIK